MHGRKRTSTVVVATAREAQDALRRGPSPELAPDEERLLRMRLGAPLPLSARLDRIATATDAEIEILAYEIEAYLRMKEAAASRVSHAPHPRFTAVPASSRTKEKIVRALRKKA